MFIPHPRGAFSPGSLCSPAWTTVTLASQGSCPGFPEHPLVLSPPTHAPVAVGIWLQPKRMACLSCKYHLLLPCEIPSALSQSMSKVTTLMGTACLLPSLLLFPSSSSPLLFRPTEDTFQTQRPRATGCSGDRPWLQHCLSHARCHPPQNSTSCLDFSPQAFNHFGSPVILKTHSTSSKSVVLSCILEPSGETLKLSQAGKCQTSSNPLVGFRPSSFWSPVPSPHPGDCNDWPRLRVSAGTV